MNIVICDYCGDRNPKLIKLTRTPNGDPAFAELCEVCLSDIANSSASGLTRSKATLSKDEKRND